MGRWRWVAAVAVILVACIGVVAVVVQGRRVVTPAVQPAATVPPTPRAAPVVEIEARGSSVPELGRRLADDDDFTHDATYLIAASVYARCVPAHAHEAGLMAARARLPVLKGADTALGNDKALRSAFLGAVRDVASQAPCGKPFVAVLGPFRQAIDADAYVRAFPDSYFDASLTMPPMEAGGQTLAERAGDECGSVVYAVLPLDQPYAWQCTGLRAQARARVMAICHGEGAEAETSAVKIRAVVESLPSTCR